MIAMQARAKAGVPRPIVWRSTIPIRPPDVTTSAGPRPDEISAMASVTRRLPRGQKPRHIGHEPLAGIGQRLSMLRAIKMRQREELHFVQTWVLHDLGILPRTHGRSGFHMPDQRAAIDTRYLLARIVQMLAQPCRLLMA
jgi:hypothetical protein